ncbi:MAG: cytochrome c class I [Bacteroidetes bacterium]|nr:MAG: cytochrome c class I [Bacteroidota bacterium]
MKKKHVQRIFSNSKGLLFIAGIVLLILIFHRSFAQSKPWVAPADADNMKNPLAGNSSVLGEAKTLYTANCGPCHGDKGKGDGLAASGLNPKPADHTSEAVQKQSDGAIFWKISEGRAPMPAYKRVFSDQQRWEFVTYIRTLSKGKKK